MFQLEAGFLADSFPPLSSLDSPELPNNLPAMLSAFVGREAEVAEITDLVAGVRLVTLTGAGGSGKTRLALQVAAELLGRGADAAWFADLAPVATASRSPAYWPAHSACRRPGCRSLRTLIQSLSGQQVLIVLDNCEHVVDAAAKFSSQVLQQCGSARILAQAARHRRRADIPGPSLSLPPDGSETAADLAGSDAVG